MSWIKKITFYFVWTFASLFFSIIILEVIFMFLPVAQTFKKNIVTKNNQILKYEPNTSIKYSLGKDFYKVVKKTSNNYGFISDIDYKKNSKPLSVIIGDSYVEALQVSNQNAIGDYINNKIISKNVYSLGISGAPLSQYLIYTKFSKNEFQPKSYTFVIVGNDFDESLCSIRPYNGFHCYDESMNLKLIPFHGDSLIKKLAKKSSFIRYLFFNVGIDFRRIFSKSNFSSIINDDKNLTFYAGNTTFDKSLNIKKKSFLVIDKFISDLKKITQNVPVWFIVDADRESIYQNKTSNSYFNKMRNYLIENARINKINVLDMKLIFKKHYKIHNKKFEFSSDGHWNELAHKLAAEKMLYQLKNVK